MRKMIRRYWHILIAAFAVLLLPASVAALAPASPYTYQDTTYDTIQDSAGNGFRFTGTGCGFENDTNVIIASKPYDPSKVSVKDSAYCESAGGTRPADAYWRTSDGQNFVVVPGSSATAAKRPAESGIAGAAKLAVFDGNGRNLEPLHNITIADKTAGGVPVGSGTSSELAFDNNCRQQAGTFSWLICPAINFANLFIDRLVGLVLDLLETEPLLLSNPRGKGLYEAWNQFRIIANILLVPIFMVSIYAMVFSSGNKYTVTRVLPRLVVAALAMQLSFFFAAIIIDIGNVLAAGISGIFNFVNDNIRADLTSAGLTLPTSLGGTPLDRGVGAVVGTGLAISLAWLFVASALPPAMVIIIGFVAGIILTFVALALRQLAIVVLVVLAPLAMLLGVLPNTEKWMREWFDNLIKLVIVYPLIVLFFAASSTLSLLAHGTGQSEVNQIIAALLPVVVLVSVPLLFRFAGRLFTQVSGLLSGVSGRAKGGIIGDYKDPGSLAYRARLTKTGRRMNRAIDIANRPGLGWTARWTQPVRTQRDYYRMGGDSAQGLVGTSFPDKLKYLVWGNRAYNSMLGVENHTLQSINNVRWFAQDAMRLRNTPGEFSAIMEGPMAQYSGGNFDRTMNTLFGLGQQVISGDISRNVAEEGLTSWQQAVKGQSRYATHFKLEDITNPALRSPAELWNSVYGTAQGIGGNLERQIAAIRTGSGTLNEQQSEGTFQALSNSLRNSQVLNRAAADMSFQGAVHSLIEKAESLNTKMRGAGLDEAAIQGLGGDEEVTIAGFYGKTGNEIRAMRAFISSALEAKRHLGVDTTNVRLDPVTN